MRQRSLSVLLFAIFTITSFMHAQEFDLRTYQAYARPGFSFDWTFFNPATNEAAWVKLPASTGLGLNISVPGLGFVKAGTLMEYSAYSRVTRIFTLAIPFLLTEDQLRFRTGAGLYIGSIGQNWQIYLNGRLVRDESYILSDDSIKTERTKKSVLLAIDQEFLHTGENLLCIMMAGTPYSPSTGLKGELLLGDYSVLNARRNDLLKLILIGIYAFFSLYHFILFAMNRKNRAYLFFAITSSLLALFLLSQTNTAYDLVLNTRLIGDLGRLSYFFIAVSLMAFYDSSVRDSISPFTRGYAMITALASVLSMISGGELIVSIWHFTLFAPFGYALLDGVILPINKLMSKNRDNNSFNINRLVFSILLMICSVALWFYAPALTINLPWPDFTFLLLAFGTAVTLAGQVVNAYRQGENLGAMLSERIETRSRELSRVVTEAEALSSSLQDTRARLGDMVEKSASDMLLATRVQRGFFPETAPKNEVWDSAISFFPASGVSGDFYDFFSKGKSFDGFVLGDVSGHGIASGLVALLGRSIFYRNFYELKNRSLGAMLEAINSELINELKGVDNFITAALLRLYADGRVEYASAAHTDLLYLGADKTRAASLRPKGVSDYKGPPLGREGLELPYSSVRFKLQSGDILLAYTDGFDEAKNVDGQPYGIKGMLDALSTAPEGDAAQILDFIVREWRFHISGAAITDDAAAILLKKK